LHPDKTRLVAFRRPSSTAGRGELPRGFDLLGFTHFWARSRKGTWVVKQKTMTSRLSRALRAIATWCREHRHDKVADQHAALCRKLQGHYAYYGITGNSRALSSFQYWALRLWHKWLRRRSNRPRTWEQTVEMLKRFPLPAPRAVHSRLLLT